VKLRPQGFVVQYEAPGWYWLLLLPAAMWAALAFTVLYVAVRHGWAGGRPPWGALGLGLLCAIVPVVICWRLARSLRLSTNGWVRVDDRGIAFRNWSGRVARLSWDEVRDMRWRLGSPTVPLSTIRIRGQRRSLDIPVLHFGGRMTPVVSEVAARAGLRCLHTSRLGLGARYAR